MYESLRGVSAILTRATEDNAALAAALERAGARVIEVPCVRVEALADLSALATAMAARDADDWIVVTSRAGADAVARAGAPRCRVAAVGAATAGRLRERGIEVAFVPTVATGEQLARELPLAKAALLARSDRALPELAAILRERGFAVDDVVAYRTVSEAGGDIAAARAALRSPGRVAVFCSSPSALTGLLAAIDRSLLSAATFFVSGTTTERAVRERLGDDVAIQPIEEEALDVARR